MIALHPTVAVAGETCDDRVTVTARAVTVDGVRGNFIPPDSMNRIVFVLTECVPSYQALIAAQGKLLDLKTEAATTSSMALAAAEELAEFEREHSLRWREAYETERELHSSTFASPTLWFSVGVAVGVAVTLGAAFAYAKVQGSL